MKLFSIFTFVLLSTVGFSQSLPFDFEGGAGSVPFVDFDGGVATIEANPFSMGENMSPFVGKIVRNGGQPWAGSKVLLSAPLDFSVNNSISMKVYTTAPVGTPVSLKLELPDTAPAELAVPTTVSGAWETLTWDFTGTDAIYTDIVFMFDINTVGNGSEASTFYFDDVAQFISEGSLLDQIDVPVTFEGDEIDYTMTDFGGTMSTLVVDPTDAANMVIQTVKPLGSAEWAGVTIGTNNGFASLLPLTLTESEMTVRVWSPTAGTPIRLKVEDSNDETHTCETQVLTTMEGAWETLEFDFSQEAPGTATLAFGLENGWVYNMASIFFNFGTTGDIAGEQTYYFDDVMFGDDGMVDLDQIDLPVTFEGTTTDYTVTDFGGNSSTLLEDPTDATNMVMQTIKTVGSEGWAGTTISTPQGLASDIPFALTESRMNVRVWSPTAGTTIRLKVEDAADATHTCETDAVTTVAGAWEVIEFDFANEVTGTPTLEFGLGEGWTFSMVSIFFNFDVSGTDEAYYFDDVMFGATDGVNNLDLANVVAYPNPSADMWTISAEKTTILSVTVYDLTGKLVSTTEAGSAQVSVDATLLDSGIYTATVVTNSGTGTIRLVKH